MDDKRWMDYVNKVIYRKETRRVAWANITGAILFLWVFGGLGVAVSGVLNGVGIDAKSRIISWWCAGAFTLITLFLYFVTGTRGMPRAARAMVLVIGVMFALLFVPGVLP